MHELSVCQGLLDQVESIAVQHGAQRINAITLHIGALSGVEPELLQQAFTLARAGGVAAQATLIIEALPIRVNCQACGRDSEALPNRLLCGHCGDFHTRLISGDELLLARVEMDVPSPVQTQQTSSRGRTTSGGNHV
jgi:hydrogenase nickel incorporation protein HypA/HybF